MSLNAKKTLKYFSKILYLKNIYFEKKSLFLAPFSAAAITGAGDNFCNFFLHILIVYFCNYKPCKFQKGF